MLIFTVRVVWKKLL